MQSLHSGTWKAGLSKYEEQRVKGGQNQQNRGGGKKASKRWAHEDDID